MLLESFVVCLAVAGVLLPLEFGYFTLQQRLIAAGYPVYHPETWLDAHIPFVPGFIWPYWGYFAFLGLGGIWLAKTRLQLAKLAAGLVGIHLVGFASYLVYPTAMKRIAIECTSLSCDAVGAMYLLDPGYGLFPSLHTALSVYLIVCAFRFESRMRWFIAAFGVSIILATVLVKQHYFVDVPAGIVLGYFGGGPFWRAAERLSEGRLPRRWFTTTESSYS